ncbi:hypothetical protein C2U68_18470 [Methylomonas koyamae]|nr:hypothetical protein C2U68_18470 [Methylomonas koyamae]
MVKVHVRVCQGPVAEDNCVVAKRGGEQSEANWRSAGDELDSAGHGGEPARRWRSLKRIEHVGLAKETMFGPYLWLEVERWDVCAR